MRDCLISSQYFRPEFRPFLENEQKTISLIRDVADWLDKVAVGPLHTPALYSSFLRVLIAAKFDNYLAVQSTASESSNLSGEQQANGVAVEGAAPNTNSLMLTNTQYQIMGLESNAEDFFQSAGEMGPAADISIFPPRMADTRTDASNVISMDSILSSDFWDSVLVPGAFFLKIRAEL